MEPTAKPSGAAQHVLCLMGACDIRPKGKLLEGSGHAAATSAISLTLFSLPRSLCWPGPTYPGLTLKYKPGCNVEVCFLA